MPGEDIVCVVDEDKSPSPNKLSPTDQLYVKVPSESIRLVLSKDIVPSESHITVLSTVKSAVIKSTLIFCIRLSEDIHSPDGLV